MKNVCESKTAAEVSSVSAVSIVTSYFSSLSNFIAAFLLLRLVLFAITVEAAESR